ncbi:MAG: pyridoxal 5'-phosphate synthase glutaminase subunit PdxT [Actinomycetota bacterium]|nr:pyridoxal 5'-phosphate synthase glutaminase subunit PdxT [Actinomycetota bacterium]
MSGPHIGVLALQGDVREHVAALESVGARAVPVRDAAGLARVDGLVIPGGESTTISMLAIRWGLMEPLQAAVRDQLPMYGSCAGMILMADTVLDGRADQQPIGGIDMVVRRNAFGRQVDSFEADVTFPAVGPDPLRAVFIRAPWVESIGPSVEVLASVPGAAGDRIVAVRAGSLLATSFHPELTGDHRVHALFVDIVARET